MSSNDNDKEAKLYQGIGARMRERRESLAGKTLEVFAAELGVTHTTLKGYENGAGRIPIHRLMDAAHRLGVSLNYLAYGRDNPPF